jgi:hypothetical protein
LVLDKNKTEIRNKIKKLKLSIQVNKQKLDKLLSKIKDQKVKTLIKNINYYVSFRSDRADLLRQILFYSEDIYNRIYKYIFKTNSKYTLKDLLFFTYDEIVCFLETGNLPEIKNIRKRLKNNYQFYDRGNFHLIESKSAKELVNSAIEKVDISSNLIKGDIAYKGIVKGNCIIVNSFKDITI